MLSPRGKMAVFLLAIGWLAAGHGFAAEALEDFAHSKIWLKALHYEQRHFGQGYKSRISDPRFFLTADGRFSPTDELTAFVEGVRTGKRYRDVPYKCIMPFRYSLVVEHHLVAPDLTPCPELAAFKQELGVDGAAIVFVAQYADNPASIMGHIFLRIENHQKRVDGRTLPYLFNTVNYAAAVPPETNIIKYLLYGVSGGFTGRYTLYEYGDTIEKYNNMEGRDIFAYQLNLSRREVEKLDEHAWELLELATQDYYFFDENCAFQVLAMLEAVRPTADLIGQLPFYTSPLDVLKAAHAAGMVTAVEFTPSLYQRVLDRLQAMSPDERSLFQDVLTGDAPPARITSPLVAEALIEALNFRKHEEHGAASAADADLKQALLSQRASLGPGSPAYPETVKVPPHLSHGSARAAAGGGSGSDGPFAAVKFRPALHDILSRDEGFQRSSSLSLLAAEVRQYGTSKRPVVEAVDLAQVSKLAGTRFQQRLAWHVDLALRARDQTCAVCLAPDFAVNVGLSRNILIDQLDVFALAKLGYRAYVGTTPWYGGVGATAGFTYTPAHDYRLIVLGSRAYNRRLVGLDAWSLALAHDLTKDVDIRLVAEFLHLQYAQVRREAAINLGYSF